MSFLRLVTDNYLRSEGIRHYRCPQVVELTMFSIRQTGRRGGFVNRSLRCPVNSPAAMGGGAGTSASNPPVR